MVQCLTPSLQFPGGMVDRWKQMAAFIGDCPSKTLINDD
jgi:hypothetical protein